MPNTPPDNSQFSGGDLQRKLDELENDIRRLPLFAPGDIFDYLTLQLRSIDEDLFARKKGSQKRSLDLAHKKVRALEAQLITLQKAKRTAETDNILQGEFQLIKSAPRQTLDQYDAALTREEHSIRTSEGNLVQKDLRNSSKQFFSWMGSNWYRQTLQRNAWESNRKHLALDDKRRRAEALRDVLEERKRQISLHEGWSEFNRAAEDSQLTPPAAQSKDNDKVKIRASLADELNQIGDIEDQIQLLSDKLKSPKVKLRTRFDIRLQIRKLRDKLESCETDPKLISKLKKQIEHLKMLKGDAAETERSRLLAGLVIYEDSLLQRGRRVIEAAQYRGTKQKNTVNGLQDAKSNLKQWYFKSNIHSSDIERLQINALLDLLEGVRAEIQQSSTLETGLSKDSAESTVAAQPDQQRIAIRKSTEDSLPPYSFFPTAGNPQSISELPSTLQGHAAGTSRTAEAMYTQLDVDMRKEWESSCRPLGGAMPEKAFAKWRQEELQRFEEWEEGQPLRHLRSYQHYLYAVKHSIEPETDQRLLETTSRSESNADDKAASLSSPQAPRGPFPALDANQNKVSTRSASKNSTAKYRFNDCPPPRTPPLYPDYHAAKQTLIPGHDPQSDSHLSKLSVADREKMDKAIREELPHASSIQLYQWTDSNSGNIQLSRPLPIQNEDTVFTLGKPKLGLPSAKIAKVYVLTRAQAIKAGLISSVGQLVKKTSSSMSTMELPSLSKATSTKKRVR